MKELFPEFWINCFIKPVHDDSAENLITQDCKKLRTMFLEFWATSLIRTFLDDSAEKFNIQEL